MSTKGWVSERCVESAGVTVFAHLAGSGSQATFLFGFDSALVSVRVQVEKGRACRADLGVNPSPILQEPFVLLLFLQSFSWQARARRPET